MQLAPGPSGPSILLVGSSFCLKLSHVGNEVVLGLRLCVNATCAKSVRSHPILSCSSCLSVKAVVMKLEVRAKILDHNRPHVLGLGWAHRS